MKLRFHCVIQFLQQYFILDAVTSNKFVLNNTSQTTHMLQFDCTGLENAIVNCIFFALTTCSDPTPVGVICNMEETGNDKLSY